MTFEATIPADNLNNITEEQMMAFAADLNALEPGGSDSDLNGFTGGDFYPMIDALDIISLSCLIAVFVYLLLPLALNLYKKLLAVSPQSLIK